jgi:hypothetical protein
MGDDSVRTKPNVLQYIRYCYGGRLPDSMRDWVRDDLAGKVHGLDPDLVDELARKRDAHIHQTYIERYGPRSDADR